MSGNVPSRLFFNPTPNQNRNSRASHAQSLTVSPWHRPPRQKALRYRPNLRASSLPGPCASRQPPWWQTPKFPAPPCPPSGPGAGRASLFDYPANLNPAGKELLRSVSASRFSGTREARTASPPRAENCTATFASAPAKWRLRAEASARGR